MFTAVFSISLFLLGCFLTCCICKTGASTIHTNMEMPLLHSPENAQETKFSDPVKVFHSMIPMAPPASRN
jgi:hypothetical protein